MRTRVKICGVASPGEVRAVVAAGADAVGLLGVAAGDVASGPGGDDPAREAAAACPPGVTPFLLTPHGEPETIAAQAEAVGVRVVQIARPLDPAAHDALRALDARLRLVQVVHVEDERALELARGYARTADALLLDAGPAPLTVAELGGAARPHDWSVSRRIAHDSPVPVWLAGGLTAANVGDAIEQVNPFGVDLCGGVRTAGRLDARKLSAVFAAVRLAKGG